MSVELQDLSTDTKFGGNAGRAARASADSEDDTNGDVKRPTGLSSSMNGGGDRKDLDMQMEPSAEEVKKTLSTGMQFMKHAHGKALSTKRQIWYKEIAGKGYICWQPVATQFNYDPKRCVPISSIKAIYLGKQTAAFGRRHSVNVNDDCAFSLETDRRTLDLEVRLQPTSHTSIGIARADNQPTKPIGCCAVRCCAVLCCYRPRVVALVIRG